MAVNIDPLTNYQRSVSARIKKHRDSSRTESAEARTVFDALAGFGSYGGRIGGAFNIPFVGDSSLGFGSWNQIKDNAERAFRGRFTNAIFGALFNPDTVEWVEYRFNQVLEERGYLKFRFDVPGSTSFILPFYENPTIRESRRANYASNEVMNRNEPYRIFTGASPMELKINFKMTLPHIMEFSIQEKMKQFRKQEQNRRDTLDENIAFAAWQIAPLDPLGAGQFMADSYSHYDATQSSFYGLTDEEFGNIGRKYLASFTSHLREQKAIMADANPVTTSFPEQPNQPWKASQEWVRSTSLDQNKVDFLSYVSHMLDTIRSSVIAASKLVNLGGPPLVYLKFGTLYNEEQFIVTSYDLKFDGKEGYDNATMLPRVIHISLSLQSYGQTHRNQQNSGSVVDRGRAPGWDTHFIRMKPY